MPRLSFISAAIVAFQFLFGPGAARAGEPADLSARLDDLERRQSEIFQQQASERGKVETFFQDKLLLGGFFESAVTGIWGNGTDTQFSATPNTLAINLAADLNGEVRFNSQLQLALSYPLQNPNNMDDASSFGLPSTRTFSLLSTGASLPQAYLEYSTDPSFYVQIGRGYAPFGIAFQTRDLVLFRRRGGPQLINANTSGTLVIAAGIWGGAHLGGSFRLGEDQWGYDAYSLTPVSNPSTLGAGARAWFKLAGGATFGVSSQIAKRGQYTYEALGADLTAKAGEAGLDAECAVNYTGAGVGSSSTFYAEPYYDFFGGKLLFYLVADYLSASTATTTDPAGNVPDPYEKWAFGGGINWLPYQFTRFRLGVLFYDYTGPSANLGGAVRDYWSLDLSAGVEF